MAEVEQPEEKPKDDAVNDYLRRFNKRKQTQTQSKTAATYGITVVLFLLFSIALGVVVFGYFYEMDYLKHHQPHNLDLHEFDEKANTGVNASTPTVAADSSPTARTLAAFVAPEFSEFFNSKYSVDGCSDDTRKQLWVHHCQVGLKLQTIFPIIKRSSSAYAPVPYSGDICSLFPFHPKTLFVEIRVFRHMSDLHVTITTCFTAMHPHLARILRLAYALANLQAPSSRVVRSVRSVQALFDGKVYPRGQEGPLVALMQTANPGTHAASLLEQPDGTLLYAWFSGKEGSAGVVIVVSTLAPGSDQVWECQRNLPTPSGETGPPPP
eukprot:921564-Prorocentrum_minimum.AAC.5